jgi:hypothetical protein
MGTDGAYSLLFCAAKRSGAFPPNMPAELRARVSRLGGFNEAVLRVIVSPSWGPALCHHGRSGYQPPSLVPNPDGVVVLCGHILYIYNGRYL